jgi:hypothetical protein
VGQCKGRGGGGLCAQHLCAWCTPLLWVQRSALQSKEKMLDSIAMRSGVGGCGWGASGMLLWQCLASASADLLRLHPAGFILFE